MSSNARDTPAPLRHSAAGTEPSISELELYCPNNACGDPIFTARLAAGAPYGTPFIVTGSADDVPRTRRRMVYLGANFMRTHFSYMCPVCAHRRKFARSWLTGAITAIEEHGP